jgi:hypothetical protein
MSLDKQFRSDRFTDPHLIRERPLSDCKQYLCKLRWSKDELLAWEQNIKNLENYESLPRSPKEDLAEFIRDVIAIANAARQRGEPGYLLFGIDDTTKNVVGIEGQSTNPKVSNKNQEKINEINERDFNEVLRKYVRPAPPTIDYFTGYVNEKLVSYLQIIPEPAPEPYQVKTNLGGIKNPLRNGDCWVRRGESKVKLEESEKQYLYAWTDAPYVSLEQWKSYLKALEAEHDIPKVEDINVEGINVYQDLRSTENILLENETENFLASSSSLLVIIGQAGSGKSVFLYNQARKRVGLLLQELENNTEHISFEEWIPTFFGLNGFSLGLGESLGRKILSRLSKPHLLNISDTKEPERLFRDAGKSWLIFLDAFDEVNPDLQNKDNIWSAIRELSEIYRNVKVIVTVRASEFRYELPKTAKLVAIAPLLWEEQVIEYLRIHVAPDNLVKDLPKEISEFLHSDDQLRKHLQIPLFLQTATSYLLGEKISEMDFVESDIISQEFTSSNKEFISGSSPDNLIRSPKISLSQIRATVDQELTDEGEIIVEEGIFSPDEEPEEVVTEIKMGVFLDRVFRQLWKYNSKKRPTGMQRAELDNTYEALGEMAAYMADCSIIRISEAKKYVNEGLYWILDLGILIMNRINNVVGVSFFTTLAKTYFAAFFITVLLETTPHELSNVIRGSPTFWEKCSLLVKDLTSADVSPLTQHIEVLKGEQTKWFSPNFVEKILRRLSLILKAQRLW